MMRVLRSVAAVVVGIAAITVVAEGIELAVVTIAHGSVTSDPEIYFSVRNQPLLLSFKLLYNGLAAFLGGYVAARIAGFVPRAHGVAVAVIQAVSLLVASISSEPPFTYTPTWMWVALIVVMTPAIVAGGVIGSRGRP